MMGPTKKKLEIATHERGLPKGLHTFINDMKTAIYYGDRYVNVSQDFIMNMH